MSLFRRRRLLRRLFQALEKVAGNIGLIREAGKEMRLFSHEEVTLVRQLGESRQRMLDLQAMRAEQARQMHGAVARQVLEALALVEERQQALMARQADLLQLCQQLLQQRDGEGGEIGAAACGGGDAGSGSGHSSGSAEGGGGASSSVDPGGVDCIVGEPASQQQHHQQKEQAVQQAQSVQAARAALEAAPEEQPTAGGRPQHQGQTPGEEQYAEPEPPAPAQLLHWQPSQQPPLQQVQSFGTRHSSGAG
ncbi:hypothetical protein ABPG75_004754 [Micractinium tetrahymenae]